MFGLAATSSHIAYNLGITVAAAAHTGSSSSFPQHFDIQKHHPRRIQSITAAWYSISSGTTAANLTQAHTQEERLCSVFRLFNLRHPRDLKSTTPLRGTSYQVPIQNTAVVHGCKLCVSFSPEQQEHVMPKVQTTGYASQHIRVR